MLERSICTADPKGVHCQAVLGQGHTHSPHVCTQHVVIVWFLAMGVLVCYEGLFKLGKRDRASTERWKLKQDTFQLDAFFARGESPLEPATKQSGGFSISRWRQSQAGCLLDELLQPNK